MCLPRFAAALDVKASAALAASIRAMNTTLFGSCEAACWLRAAATCTRHGSNKAACDADSACTFNPRAGACVKSQVSKPGRDTYDDQLNALMVWLGCRVVQLLPDAYRGTIPSPLLFVPLHSPMHYVGYLQQRMCPHVRWQHSTYTSSYTLVHFITLSSAERMWQAHATGSMHSQACDAGTSWQMGYMAAARCCHQVLRCWVLQCAPLRQ